MADMKLDEAKLLERLETTTKAIYKELGFQVDAAREEVMLVSDAVRNTPDSFSQLLQSAAVALVKEIQVGGQSPANDHNGLQVSAAVGIQGCSYQMAEHDEQRRVPPGKYRALFFLVKVEDGNRACDDCGVVGPLMIKSDHHGGQKSVCVSRDACNRRPQR